ncbi:MAG: CBS domain-containing protein [Gemmatimonadetes bacterium]|nr:CBS domain-containing protein [Gemmatimonadota bacterium]NNF12883.1 CBS domain-containing protein [Gemmatimonadota bacterium]
MTEPGSEDLTVEDAAEPAKYRVYADTPLDEVVDLMVRRGLRAIPVVGERYEVLGIITTGDALGRVLREAPSEEGEAAGAGAPTARDIMTRAVLCVSEAQPLVDAARMMVNRKVEQLPVVRDGELVGLVTRNAVLRALHGETHDERDDPNET